MWVLNSDRDILINLQTGLRIAIMPSKKDGEAQLYGVVVQAPAEATLPVGRPLPTGYSNTLLLHSAPLDDCENLLKQLLFRLEAWVIPHLPIEIDDPEPVILTYTDENSIAYTFVCEDEATAMKLLYGHVSRRWSTCFDTPIPEDKEQAIDVYYECTGAVESRKITQTTYITWKDLESKRR
ncbi:MAG: hypothetical protein HS114_34920 [Anaerolineales bacterium]|nr:hypothetical protein [Anaerolineales bacterium]